MKRIFPVIICIVLLASLLLAGCNSTGKTQISVKESLNNNYEIISDEYTEIPDTYDFGTFTGAVCEWADENGIDYISSAGKYLILTKESGGEIKNVEDFTFHAAIDLSNPSNTDNSLQSAAAVMTILSQSNNHGNITGIFTSIDKGQASGAEAVPSEYLDDDNFIDVTKSKKAIIYNTFAASSTMSAVKDLNITEPTYTKAYTIKFSGIENQSAYRNRGTYPNPIKTVGDLLASCQTSTVLFELASFEGGKYSDQIPSEVSATIVLHENDVESFTKKFNKSYEKVEKFYEELEDETITFEYTMEPVDLPSQIISKEDTENIVSLMYTMINGTYYRNDDDVVEAYSNIGKISTEDGRFTLNINAKALTDELMEELEGVVKTICGLSDIGYEKIDSTPVWTNDPETPLVASLSEALDADCSGFLEMKHASVFIDKNEDINLISWGTNLDDAEDDIEEIFEYMAIAGVKITE